MMTRPAKHEDFPREKTEGTESHAGDIHWFVKIAIAIGSLRGIPCPLHWATFFLDGLCCGSR